MRFSKPASNSKDLKVLNRLLVRETIRRRGPIARYEVARVTGLTPPTVTGIVGEFLRAGVVREIGPGESNGGRRPILLKLNPRAGYVLAVRIQRGEVLVALLDLANNILRDRRQGLVGTGPEDVLREAEMSFAEFVRDEGIGEEEVLWCGVAVPGLVNSGRGLVERSSNMEWVQVPFGELLSARLGGIPVCVENNSNAAALAEKEYGTARGCRSLIYLNLSVGIGGGILIDGEIYGGAQGFAGELGHVAVVTDGGNPCTCGRRGCLESSCGVGAVLDRVRAEVPAAVFRRMRLERNSVTLDDVLASLSAAPEVQRILTDTGRLIGGAVGIFINIFNPEMVILGGELSRAGRVLLEAVDQAAAERAITRLAQSARIMNSIMTEDPQLMGAYALALKRIFALDDWPGERRASSGAVAKGGGKSPERMLKSAQDPVSVRPGGINGSML